MKDFFTKAGADEKIAEKLAKMVSQQGYELLVNPKTVELEEGGQIWGSGGYEAEFQVWLGKIKEIERKTEITQFIRRNIITATAKTIPCIVSCYSGDCVGPNGRDFKKFIAVWWKRGGI